MDYIFEDVNEAFSVMWHRMWTDDGIMIRESRNGPVRESVMPVMITYKNPRKRVLFHEKRDANPFFHLFEAIWMLAGRTEVMWLAQFNKGMLEFSDDGKTLVSAYGARWREVLEPTLNKLRFDRNTRRAYVPIFHPEDAERNGKDVPCNVGVSFNIRDGHLDMSVFNRSNDMLWGALGANVVHWSFFQEYVAMLCDLDIGRYTQISSNFHLYSEFEVTKKLIGHVDPHPMSPYKYEVVAPSSIWVINSRTEEGWQEDAKLFINDYTNGMFWKKIKRWWNDPFFEYIACPMFRAWWLWKYEKDFKQAYEHMEAVHATDWKLAGMQWLRRREKDKEKKFPLAEPVDMRPTMPFDIGGISMGHAHGILQNEEQK